MQGDSVSTNRQAFHQWIDRLACPACHGTLLVEGATVLCTACKRSYPVIDGIPVLIPERATDHAEV